MYSLIWTHFIKENVTVEVYLCHLLHILIDLPVSRGSDGAVRLSRVINNGTLTTTGYTLFLNSSVLVTGAILASTGECTISEMVTFYTSTREIETKGTPEYVI